MACQHALRRGVSARHAVPSRGDCVHQVGLACRYIAISNALIIIASHREHSNSTAKVVTTLTYPCFSGSSAPRYRTRRWKIAKTTQNTRVIHPSRAFRGQTTMERSSSERSQSNASSKTKRHPNCLVWLQIAPSTISTAGVNSRSQGPTSNNWTF